MPDLFVITGIEEEIRKVSGQINGEIYAPADQSDIDWTKVTRLAERLEELAELLYNEAEDEE